MTTYETLLIADPNFEKKDVTKLVEKTEAALAKTGARLAKITEWGRKKLAYEIKKQGEGYYILFEFEGAKDSAKKFAEFLKLQEEVLRSMTTRKFV
ncbi:MAG: 30S ribosomal protein S6 [Candidatus Wallbacteria bacterium]|nr:30S ribosomal protein S6 [Candidatus Wallbacteria bacterium]